MDQSSPMVRLHDFLAWSIVVPYHDVGEGEYNKMCLDILKAENPRPQEMQLALAATYSTTMANVVDFPVVIYEQHKHPC